MNPRGDKYFYPVTKKTVHRYVASVFGPIQKGESVTTIWVPMAGRRMWSKFIIENIDLFKKEFPNYQDYLLVYVEPLELTEESLAGYFRLMGKLFVETCRKSKKCQKETFLDKLAKTFEDELASYSKLFSALKELLRKVNQVGLKVVFFLAEFDELNFANRVFYNNLKALWDTFKPNLHYIFLSIEDLTSPEVTVKMGELNSASLQNMIYVPIRQGEDIDYLIEFFGERLDREFVKKEIEVLKKMCGGHPYMLKAATRILASLDQGQAKTKDMEEILSSHYEMLSVARRIFDLRTSKEQDLIHRIALEENVRLSNDLRRLLSLGLVESQSGQYRLFSQLFTQAALKHERETQPASEREKEGLYLNHKRGIVCYAGSPVEEKFTGQEYNVIKFFLEEPGTLRTRDELSEILWGEESYEKYSDWAIDQLMSKVRRKLKKLGTKANLVTVRGRGYKLV